MKLGCVISGYNNLVSIKDSVKREENHHHHHELKLIPIIKTKQVKLFFNTFAPPLAAAAFLLFSPISATPEALSRIMRIIHLWLVEAFVGKLTFKEITILCLTVKLLAIGNTKVQIIVLVSNDELLGKDQPNNALAAIKDAFNVLAHAPSTHDVYYIRHFCSKLIYWRLINRLPYNESYFGHWDNRLHGECVSVIQIFYHKAINALRRDYPVVQSLHKDVAVTVWLIPVPIEQVLAILFDTTIVKILFNVQTIVVTVIVCVILNKGYATVQWFSPLQNAYDILQTIGVQYSSTLLLVNLHRPLISFLSSIAKTAYGSKNILERNTQQLRDSHRLLIGIGAALISDNHIYHETVCMLIISSAQTIDIQRGATLFRQTCIGCHDAGGNIIQPGSTLYTKDLQRNGVDTEEEIYRVTYYGKGRMPGFGKECTPRGQCTFGARLEDEEIKILAEFVKLQADQGWPSIETGEK
ncbi:cytochrome c6 [Trifolium pratense]|uniref:Cytochrome c-553 n=1 Tax=Trifolium pratense TaxID=57577 RepID=A0A2K3PI59_TRIPR|nr:cytochrome c6 [Trifolium pratense]